MASLPVLARFLFPRIASVTGRSSDGFMNIHHLGITGIVLLTPKRFEDERGHFSETWNARRMRDAGMRFDFVQDNHSLSRDAGVLRGLHYQAPPVAQTKLIRCTAGAIFDVAVDIRRGSPGFGQWITAVLTPENGSQLLIPRGFLHGFLALRPNTEVQYKVDAYYDAACDGAIAWDDPDIGIEWPLAEAGVSAPYLSKKDAAAPRLAEIEPPFFWNEAHRTESELHREQSP